MENSMQPNRIHSQIPIYIWTKQCSCYEWCKFHLKSEELQWNIRHRIPYSYVFREIEVEASTFFWAYTHSLCQMEFEILIISMCLATAMFSRSENKKKGAKKMRASLMVITVAKNVCTVCVWHIILGLLISARSYETWSDTVYARCIKCLWRDDNIFFFFFFWEQEYLLGFFLSVVHSLCGTILFRKKCYDIPFLFFMTWERGIGIHSWWKE